MKTLRDLVLIQADEPKTKTDSGFLVPTEDRDGWKSLPPTGTVLSVGPLVSTVKVGDRVMFERYGSIILEAQGQRMCKESHLMATLENE